MLEIKNGDLFINAGKPAIIAHGCNTKGVMGSGFARRLRNHYPAAFLAYRRAFIEDGLCLGEVIFSVSRGMHVANIITQENFGRNEKTVYVNYDAVKKGLAATKQYAHITHLPIHLPFIGGGLANGDRSILLEIFKEVLYDAPATLWNID